MWLSSWSRVILERLSHSVKKFTFYGIVKFITMLTRACYWSPFKAKWIQSALSQFLWGIFLYKSCKWSFSFRFSDKTYICITHLSHAYYMPHLYDFSWFDNPNNFKSSQYTIFSSLLLLPLRLKYSSQYNFS